ncbi:MAG: hypothetical protein ACRDTQ_20910 [Micromonosporaceae bacterium]
MIWCLPGLVGWGLLGFDGLGWLRWLPLATAPLIAARAAWVLVASRRDRGRIPASGNTIEWQRDAAEAAPILRPASAWPDDTLVIHAKHPAVPFYSISGPLSKPFVVINGYRVALRWGKNHVPCPPGVHHISVRTNNILASAPLTVDNRYGPARPVYLAESWGNIWPTALSHENLRCPGEDVAILVHVSSTVLFVVMGLAGVTPMLIPAILVQLLLAYWYVKSGQDDPG